MFRIEYTARAELDLMEIGLYLEGERGPEFAIAYLRDMRDRIATLSQMPRRTRERTELGRGQHALILRPYLAFYRVEGDVVRIQRIVRGSRKITRRLLRE